MFQRWIIKATKQFTISERPYVYVRFLPTYCEKLIIWAESHACYWTVMDEGVYALRFVPCNVIKFNGLIHAQSYQETYASGVDAHLINVYIAPFEISDCAIVIV